MSERTGGHRPAPKQSISKTHGGGWRARALVLGLLLLGAALRMIAFGSVPPGLYHDEARHGLDALDVLGGSPALYFEANNGREPLFIYLVSLGVATLGRTPWAVRIPSFFVGFLTLVLTYDLARTLGSPRIGRWGLAVFAITLWPIHLSRVGYRAVLLPLFTALFLAQAARGLRSRNLKHWIVAGLGYGLSWYTYSAVRLTPLALAGMVLYGAVFHRNALRQHWKGALTFGLAAIVVLIPLGGYTLTHPTTVLTRPGQVSVFSETINQGRPWRTLGAHILRTAGMFFIRGDRIWRHNLSHRPVWDPALGLAFVVGLVLLFTRFRKSPSAALILIWTGVMAVPTVLAEDAPHFLRAVGMLPVVALIPVWGLAWMEKRAARLHPVARGLPAMVILIGLASTAHAYFARYAGAELAHHWFETGPVQLAGEVNRLRGEGWTGTRMLHGPPTDRSVLIDRGLYESWTAIPYLVPESQVQFFDETPVRPIAPGVAFVVWPYRDWQSDVMPRLPHPAYLYRIEGPEAQGDRDPEPYIIADIVVADPLPPLPPAVARFENGITLHAALVEPEEDATRVRLWWRASAEIAGNYTVFVHYIRNGEGITQHDGPPARGALPTRIWQPEDVILDVHPLPALDPQPRRDQLSIGLYDPETGVRLKRIDETGDVLGESIELGVILTGGNP